LRALCFACHSDAVVDVTDIISRVIGMTRATRSTGAAGWKRRPTGVSTGRSLSGRGSREETPGADKNYMVSAKDAFATFAQLWALCQYQAIASSFHF
jgi:hypothetical protein